MCIWKSRIVATLPTDPEHHVKIFCHKCFRETNLCEMYDNGADKDYLLCVYCYNVYLVNFEIQEIIA